MEFRIDILLVSLVEGCQQIKENGFTMSEFLMMLQNDMLTFSYSFSYVRLNTSVIICYDLSSVRSNINTSLILIK